MIKDEDAGLKVAEYLLEIKAVKFQPKNHFTWASGWKSPIYCDNRKILSYPKIRTYIRQQLTEKVTDTYSTPDAIVGVATGGISHGVLVAQDLGLPFGYVRAKAKEHGLANQVEGGIEAGQSAVVVEDLVSTGQSSLSAVDALAKANIKVKGMIAIFTYGFAVAEKAFEEKKCNLITLTDYDLMIRAAVEKNYISDKDIVTLRKWRENPKVWKNDNV